MNIKNIIAIAMGGMIGSWLRYGIYSWLDMDGFPFATLFVNSFGSFLLGVLTGATCQLFIKEWMRVGLGVGLCGGFTTMSAFSEDVWRLLVNGHTVSFIIYVVTSVGLGITLAACGYLLANKWLLFMNRKRSRQVGGR